MRVEDGLQQKIAELVGEFVPIAVVDGVQHFVGLFEVKGLMLSKVCSRSQGQPPGSAQARHDLDQLLKLLAGSLGIHLGWEAISPNVTYQVCLTFLSANPQPSEHAAYYSRYVDLVPDGDILGRSPARSTARSPNCGKSRRPIP